MEIDWDGYSSKYNKTLILYRNGNILGILNEKHSETLDDQGRMELFVEFDCLLDDVYILMISYVRSFTTDI
jgi:type IV secretory pathway VirB4 component